MRRAVFLDKDGTIVRNVPYNADPAKLCLLPRNCAGLRQLAASGYQLIVVSNQPGIALGRFSGDAMRGVARRLSELLSREGLHLAGFYFCPHHPNGVDAAFSRRCACRKPAPGLLLEAARSHGIDLTQSWMIGDILDDVEAGARAGCRTVLVDRGGETEWILTPARVPDIVAPDIDSVAPLMLTRDARGGALTT